MPDELKEFPRMLTGEICAAHDCPEKGRFLELRLWKNQFIRLYCTKKQIAPFFNEPGLPFGLILASYYVRKDGKPRMIDFMYIKEKEHSRHGK